MPDTTLAAAPFILQKPLLSIGSTGTGIIYQCSANEVAVSCEQDETTTETFCGTYTTYKPEVWTITVTILMSYGAAAFWNLVRPMVGTLQPFTIQPDAVAAVSASNPKMTGSAIVKAFDFLNAPVGEASEIEFVLAVQGIPTFPITFEAAAADLREIETAIGEGREPFLT